MKSNVTICAVQMACTQQTEANLVQAESLVRQAAEQGAQVVCLQELFSTRYFCQAEDHSHFRLAESIPGPTTERLGRLAAEMKVVIVAGLFERRARGVFHNSAAILDADGSLAGVYRKMHIPDDPYFMEKFYFTPGDLGFQAFRTQYARIGVCICWDQWFPEAARITALHGAEVLVFPTAIGWLDEDTGETAEAQRNAWQTMMMSHAIANGVFVVAPNRVQREDNIVFWGSSFICDPAGRILARGSQTESQCVAAICDLDCIEAARTHWPFLRDRRIDAYQELMRRWIDG